MVRFLLAAAAAFLMFRLAAARCFSVAISRASTPRKIDVKASQKVNVETPGALAALVVCERMTALIVAATAFCFLPHTRLAATIALA